MSERIPTQTRILTFEVAERAEGDGRIPVVISSDDVVEVSDGPEILVHTEQAVDLRRAPIPIIAAHRSNQVNVGTIEDLTIKNGKLRGMARFGKREEAAGYEADVRIGVIRSVSVGYARLKGRLQKDGVLVTERWMPTHAAMVAEPADINAGFFRALDVAPAFVGEQEPTEQEKAARAAPTPAGNPAVTKETTMSDVITAPAGAPAETKFSAQDYEKARVRAIEFFCKANKIDERAQAQWISGGASVDTVGEEILKLVEARNKAAGPLTQIGLTTNETNKFSMWRAIQAVSSGDWTHAGFELAASRAVAEKVQRTPKRNSFFIPMEVQQREVMKRDASVAGTGAYLVATENQGFVELLRNRMVVRQMGATVLGGLIGNVTIPKQTAGATAYWLASETTQITEGNQTFGQLALSPKTVGAYTEVSRLLQLQSSPDIDGLIMSDLAKQVGIAGDLAALNGSGSGGQPAGLIGTSGAGSVSMGSFDYADILNFQEDVAAANALEGSLGYVTTHAVASLCMQRVKFASTASPLWEGNLKDGTLAGFKAMSSNQIPSGDMIFGDWSQLVIGEWGVLELAVDDKANFQAGISGIRCFYTMDVGVRIPAAFSIGTSAT